MQLQFGVAEPVPKLANLRAIPIVQMLPRAKYLYGRYARLQNPIQPYGCQTVIDKKMRGENVIHSSL